MDQNLQDQQLLRLQFLSNANLSISLPACTFDSWPYIARMFSKNVGPMSKNIADFYKFLAILKKIIASRQKHAYTYNNTHTDTKKYGTKQSGRVNGSEKTRGKPPDVKINNINKFKVKQNRHAVIEIKCTCSLVSHPPKLIADL